MRILQDDPRGAGDALAKVAFSPSERPAVRGVALVGLARYPRAEYRVQIEQATGDPLPEIRTVAATTLGTYDDDAACDRLGAMVLETPDPDPAVRIGAVQGLGRSKCLKALAWLVRIAERESDPAVHRSAVVAAYAKVSRNYYLGESESATEIKRRIAAEYLKGDLTVQEAYRQAAWPLERHPEILPPSLHRMK
ncbi:MAG: HEAT repeat domain-containing protein [Planctomycetota bacterium]|nr:HEAT repeat domain-containing protein [Planctomycetota bacterium]